MDMCSVVQCPVQSTPAPSVSPRSCLAGPFSCEDKRPSVSLPPAPSAPSCPPPSTPTSYSSSDSPPGLRASWSFHGPCFLLLLSSSGSLAPNVTPTGLAALSPKESPFLRARAVLQSPPRLRTSFQFHCAHIRTLSHCLSSLPRARRCLSCPSSSSLTPRMLPKGTSGRGSSLAEAPGNLGRLQAESMPCSLSVVFFSFLDCQYFEDRAAGYYTVCGLFCMNEKNSAEQNF